MKHDREKWAYEEADWRAGNTEDQLKSLLDHAKVEICNAWHQAQVQADRAVRAEQERDRLLAAHVAILRAWNDGDPHKARELSEQALREHEESSQ